MWIKRYKETGGVDDVPKLGRPRATTKKQNLQVVKMTEGDKPMTTSEIVNKLAEKGVTVSRTTIQRRLKKSGLYYGNTTKKPLLNQNHIE